MFGLSRRSFGGFVCFFLGFGSLNQKGANELVPFRLAWAQFSLGVFPVVFVPRKFENWMMFEVLQGCL